MKEGADGKDLTLSIVTACIVVGEVFMWLERLTGGGINTALAAAGTGAVFMVLVGLVYPKMTNEKIKMAFNFLFAGMEFLSVYIMKGIMGNIFFAVIPAAIVFAGTIEMLHKAEAGKKKAERFAKKEMRAPKTVVAEVVVPEATEEEIAAEEAAVAEAI